MIERSKDFRRIKRIGCWDDLFITDDCHYLIENDGEKDLGVFLYHPCDDGIMAHINFQEGSRGSIAAESARNSFAWIFDNTSFNIIYALIPEEKKRVHMFACSVGFKFISCGDDGRRYSLERPIDMKVAV